MADKHTKATKQEIKQVAKEWAEFLYDEYRLMQHKKLLMTKKNATIKELTNHDKRKL